MIAEQKHTILKGVPISRGIAMGFVHYCEKKDQFSYNSYSLHVSQIEKEIHRFRSAVQKSKLEIHKLKSYYNQRSKDEEGILSGHLLMLEDPLITVEVEEKIRDQKKNSAFVFSSTISEFKQKFFEMKDDYFQQRAFDISDVSNRILGHLNPTKGKVITNAPLNSIVITDSLGPTDVMEVNEDNVLGFVTKMGGKNSHAAIIAKARGIPHVSGIDLSVFKNDPIGFIIVDAIEGKVIINPSDEIIREYQGKLEEQFEIIQKIEKERDLITETIDGYKVYLYGSLDTFDDLETLYESRIKGIGLFRSEHLYFRDKKMPSEEEQFQIYGDMIKKMEPRPVIIRAFDLELSQLDAYSSKEFPPLCCRALRSLLQRVDVFRSQIRAIIRASVFGRVKILLPMVTDLSELIRAKKLIKEEEANLGVSVYLEIGAMIEVPASVIMCETLAKEVDFFSIGSNDLVQYTLAADRNSSELDEYFSVIHPSVLRLLRMVVTSANRHGKQVILCGELAADTRLIPILLGLGIQRFTVSSRQIPFVKNAIRSQNIVDVYQKAEKAFEHHSADDLLEYIKNC